MILKTKHFGTLEVSGDLVYTFPEGIPGFEDEKCFALILNTDDTSPFKWLQAVNNEDLAFAVIDPFYVKSDYEIDIPDSDVEFLDIKDVKDVLLLAIVVVPEDIKKISANLLAPVVINTMSKKAKQITAKTDKYSLRHYIFEELQKNGGDSQC